MIEIFGPGWGNYAIRGIVETSIPQQISLRPATAGWWILLALILGGAVYFAWRRWQRHVRDRYRRDAQAALDALEASYRQGDQDCLRELAPLLRATVIDALGQRDRVVSLSGDAWQRVLQDMAPKLPPLPVFQLEALAYQSLTDVGPGLDSLFAQLRAWITAHELPSA